LPDTIRHLPPDMKLVLILRNPKAGVRSGEIRVQRLSEMLAEKGFSVETFTDLDEFSDRAAATHRHGTLRAVVAAGGDGTAATVVNRTERGVPVIVFPLGTENVLAKYLGIKGDPQFAVDAIVRGATVQLDAGKAGGRLFTLMVGCGFDADVVRRLHEGRQGHIHHLSYAKPILDSIRNYQYPRLRVYCDVAADVGGGVVRQEIAARWVFVVNLPRYAGGLNFVPDAVGNDGLLDVCTFRDGSLWHGLHYLTRTVFDRHRSLEGCTTVRTGRVRIEADEEAPYQLDGDPGGTLPLDIEILPGRLTLVVTETWAQGHGFSTEGNCKL